MAIVHLLNVSVQVRVFFEGRFPGECPFDIRARHFYDFKPDADDEFTVVGATQLSLSPFANVGDEERLATVDGVGSFQVNFGTGGAHLLQVTLSDFLPTFSADFDFDGSVDDNDLTDPIDGWETRFGADLDGGNFLDWQRQLGSGNSGLAASQGVPEPRLTVFVLGAVILRQHATGRATTTIDGAAECAGHCAHRCRSGQP